MKLRLDLPKPILGLAILITFSFHTHSLWAEKAQCADVWDRGHLNVVTINLAFFEIARRDERLERLADFADAKAQSGEPIDIFLLQEGTAGKLMGTGGSPKDLQDKLQARGLLYDQRTAVSTGVPGILTVGNAILSRCEIDFSASKLLPTTFEQIEIEQVGRLAMPITRNVMMVRLKIPGASRDYRRINVYNTHLCTGGSSSIVYEGVSISASGCSVDQRQHQLASLLKFVTAVERVFSFFGEKPHILGGDFNIDNFRGGEPGQFGNEKPLYDSVTGAGFIDAYAQSQMDKGIPLQALCVRTTDPFAPLPDHPDLYQAWEPDEHCTTGVSFLDQSGPFPEFFDSTPRRIDYVFTKGFGVEQGEVIFNPNASPPRPLEPIVSDHAGVSVRLSLQ
ncbi:endonuclease/exonuclease/phosphatase family protein [Nitrosomonas sp. ANs5]|uniref:endonuclease/exonuclease/phosphatase family protein n=1 Tax=Nitrosomonas sp. ANs5 TaxID=3423941 RepID=UPI003D33DBDD